MDKFTMTPERCVRMAAMEGDAEIGAGAGALPGMIASMYARRHEISDKEWRDSGPVLLGMVMHLLTEEPDPNTIEHLTAAQVDVERLRADLSKEAVDWRHNAYSRVVFARMHDRLAALSVNDREDVPARFVLVPREPTEEMLAAGFGACVAEWPDEQCRAELPHIYRAMLAAVKEGE